MSAISEQATIDAAASSMTVPAGTLPAVQYNFAGKIIEASVIIFSAADGSGFTFQVPGIVIPGPVGTSWTVIWTLQTVGDLTAKFEEDSAVEIPIPIPDQGELNGLTFSPSSIPFSHPDQIMITIGNNISTTQVFNYKLQPTVTDAASNFLQQSESILIVDPTIAVVQEPLVV